MRKSKKGTAPEQASLAQQNAKDKPIVVFENVTKIYKLFKSPRQRMLGLFLKRFAPPTVKAIDDVSFTVNRGEAVALLGKNGAGKSTILKMMTGVCFPTKGEIEVNGIVSALLELTTGFDPEFSGIENIHLKCQIMGLTEEQIKEKEPEIIEFANIGDYITQPVRTYSSGMKARLGFAISANIDPEILIIDEVLSVGDNEFKKKCLNKVNEIMADKNVTLLFVTHMVEVAKEFCKRGIFLQKGKMIFDGDIDEAIEKYNATIK